MRLVISKIKVCLVAPFPPPSGGMSVQAQILLDCLRREAIVVYPVKTNREGKIWVTRTLAFAKDLLRSILASNVVHVFTALGSYTSLAITAMCVLTPRVFGRRLIVSHHSSANRFLNRWSFLVRSIYRMANVVTAQSGYLANIFSQLGIRSYEFPNLLDTSEFEYVERNNFSPKLLFARHLIPAYGAEDAIIAYQIIVEKRPDATLTIVGDGSERRKLENMARRLGLTVRFMGGLNHEEMSGVYRTNDIFLICSKGDNFPMVILEAAASGLPIVSTRVQGIPYMIQDGRNGILVSPGNCSEMAQAVLNLIDNPDRARCLARRAKEFADECTWEKNKLRLFSIYLGNV